MYSFDKKFVNAVLNIQGRMQELVLGRALFLCIIRWGALTENYNVPSNLHKKR